MIKRIIFLWLMLTGTVPVLFAQQTETPSAAAEPITEGMDSLRKTKVLIYPGFGLGLVRNQLSPSFYINLGIMYKNRYEGNINTSSFFYFEEGSDGKYNVHRNTFLNAEFLLNFSPLGNNVKNWNGLGVGYLIEARGAYFKETAMILYVKRKFRYFSVMPGLVFDDNFKDVWPVISIRL